MTFLIIFIFAIVTLSKASLAQRKEMSPHQTNLLNIFNNANQIVPGFPDVSQCVLIIITSTNSTIEDKQGITHKTFCDTNNDYCIPYRHEFLELLLP